AYTTPAWWLALADADRPLRPTERAEWLAGEGAYLRALVCGPLHWWGLLDLATDSAGMARAFRLTRFGTFLLGRAEAAAEDEAALAGARARLPGPVVLPMREGALAVEPLAAGAALLDALAEWARPTGVAGGRLIYSLAPDLAVAAFDRGARPDALLARLRALDERAAERAADLLAARLAEWRARYGRTRIADGMTLVEAADEAALIEALALAPALAARCHRLGPALALLSPDDAEALRRLLTRRGYHL
ncbi:MAG: hypothetical protein IVW57_14520, partial [Ktedonobacterales bacterium]|nr:hypothetical protein [Ktedonobacterales bacterium]